MTAHAHPNSVRDTGAGTASTGISGSEEPSCSAYGWQFLILARVANFTVLRRQLGRSRAAVLVAEIGRRSMTVIADARTMSIAAEVVEIAFARATRDALEGALASLDAAFELPFLLDGVAHRVEIILGAAAAPAIGVDDVRVVEEAERAVGDACTGRRPVIRDVGAPSPAGDGIALKRDLTAAIDNGEMFLHYQPKVHLRKQEVTSVEALIRWKHPTRGMILPNDFIPIAENSRDIVEMTVWTIRQVIADQRVLKRHGYELRVFINIAGVLLSNPRFVQTACDLVRSGGVPIGFEITETSVIRDPDMAIAHLRTFADMGITIAIDDYGAGLSSLAYLKRLPARELKIDKLFVTQLASSNLDPLIVRSTIDLAHALEMEVVAEGVETPATLALLTVMGCDMVQGFLISRPLAINALIAFLDAGLNLALSARTRIPMRHLTAAPKPS